MTHFQCNYCQDLCKTLLRVVAHDVDQSFSDARIHDVQRLYPTAPGRTASPAQLLWPKGFLCGWSIGLEFPAGQLAESDYWREQFQTISEDVYVRNVLMHSAH